MLAHALLVFYRSLLAHRLYMILNVFGLATGIATFLVLTLVVRYESGYDHWLPDAHDIYRLDSTWMPPGQPVQENGDTSFRALPDLLTDFPQILAGARVLGRDRPVSAGSVLDSEEVTYADPNVLDLLRLPLLAGDRALALATPSSLVISESIARKYFGTTMALGRTLDIKQGGENKAYTVSAVMRDLPPDTTLRIVMLAAFTPSLEASMATFQDWSATAGETYLRFRNDRDAAQVAAGLRRFLMRRAAGTSRQQEGPHPERDMALSLVRLTDAHLHDGPVSSVNVPGVDPRVLFSLQAVGVLALLMAAINYVNLATARAGLRAREVALRKVMGATRPALLLQFLGESLALVTMAALVGLALTELAVPLANAAGGWNVRIAYATLLPWLAVLVLLLGLGAGLYPAILVAMVRPAAVLASSRMPSGGRAGQRLRTALVLVQFASAAAFAICTLVVDAQASYMGRADRGFERDGLVLVQGTRQFDLATRLGTILDGFRQVPGVVAATLSDREPRPQGAHSTTVDQPGHPGPQPELLIETVARDYFPTYRIPLVAGRLFDQTHGQDDVAHAGGSGTWSTILNRQAAEILGYPNPRAAIGRQFRAEDVSYVVIGVVQDVRFMSAHDPVTPQFYIQDSAPFAYPVAAVRFQGVPRDVVTRGLQAAWQRIVPDEAFKSTSVETRLSDYTRGDTQRAQLFSVGAALAVAIACIGLYGLAAFSTARRTREIGIRKVLGASTASVLALLVSQFVRPVLLANLVACPVAWLAMRDWLAGFDQRIALSPFYFAAATLGALVLSVLTVLGQAWRVARAEPARALRHE